VKRAWLKSVMRSILRRLDEELIWVGWMYWPFVWDEYYGDGPDERPRETEGL
jgi:hypothetical protein